MKAVLLAAGLGRRLRPVTLSMPKQMVPVGGRPMLEYLVEDLKKCGIADLCLVVGHGGDQIKSHLGDGKSLGVKIEYRTQTRYDGTGSALSQARDFVDDGRFLVYLSDTLIPDLKQHVSAMQRTQDASVLVCRVRPEERSSVGNVTVQEGLVTAMAEKCEGAGSNLAWAGVAAFKGSHVFDAIKRTPTSSRGEHEITDAMNTMITDGKTITGHMCSRYIDFGTPRGLSEASRYILAERGT